MSNYGRNFEFRVPPRSGERAGRYFNNEATAFPIGAPVVVVDDDLDDMGNQPVELAQGTQVAPNPGQGGIAVYEHAPAAYAGNDPYLTTYSDIDTVPAGKAVQVVNGTTVKVCLRNTSDETFLETRDYDGRVMVHGLSNATPTLVVGDFLTPGLGTDVAGYWGETSVAANAWLVVTKVDTDRGEVEARLTF